MQAPDALKKKRIIVNESDSVEPVALAVRDAAIASLRQLLGDRLSTAAVVREQHGKDASYHPCVAPDAVAFAQSSEEVIEIVKICARHKVPLIPFGSGRGVEGHVVALKSGVCLAQLLLGTDDPNEVVKAGGIKLRGQASALVPVLFPNEYPALSAWDRF